MGLGLKLYHSYTEAILNQRPDHTGSERCDANSVRSLGRTQTHHKHNRGQVHWDDEKIFNAMTQEQVTDFITRIDKLTPDSKAKFGIMNAGQMICHCTDQLRHTLGLRKIDRHENVNPTEIINLAKAGKPVPTPKGLGQVEGDGTKPTDFITDRETLKRHIIEFSQLTGNFQFFPHPYFGDYDKQRWTNFVIYHLNHHLGQFGV